MRRAAKRDSNEPAIVQALEQTGWLVQRLDQPCDLLCYHAGLERIALVEVKRPKGGRFTPLQVAFRQRWPVYVLTTPEQAIQFGKI